MKFLGLLLYPWSLLTRESFTPGNRPLSNWKGLRVTRARFLHDSETPIKLRSWKLKVLASVKMKKHKCVIENIIVKKSRSNFSTSEFWRSYWYTSIELLLDTWLISTSFFPFSIKQEYRLKWGYLCGINHSLTKKQTVWFVAKFLACKNKKHANFVVLAYKFCSANCALSANGFIFSK